MGAIIVGRDKPLLEPEMWIPDRLAVNIVKRFWRFRYSIGLNPFLYGHAEIIGLGTAVA
jgi:hypothetical protein